MASTHRGPALPRITRTILKKMWNHPCFSGFFRRIQVLLHPPKQLFNIPWGEFAHVANTECLALQRAVTVGDAHAALTEERVEIANIDVLRVVDGSDCLGAIALWGIEIQAAVDRPFLRHLGHGRVARDARLPPPSECG